MNNVKEGPHRERGNRSAMYTDSRNSGSLV
jgi:hypothetical protein